MSGGASLTRPTNRTELTVGRANAVPPGVKSQTADSKKAPLGRFFALVGRADIADSKKAPLGRFFTLVGRAG